MIQVTWCSYC